MVGLLYAKKNFDKDNPFKGACRRGKFPPKNISNYCEFVVYVHCMYRLIMIILSKKEVGQKQHL